MISKNLLHTFSSALGWNAFSYTAYKILFTGLSFLLYDRLNINDFAMWANINSLVYILLLWIDFGFRKSIARFIPEFSSNTIQLGHFVTKLIVFKVITLVCAIPLFSIIAPIICKKIGLSVEPIFFILGSLILITYGVTSIIKLIYHAHFWQKEFNILSTLLLIIEMAVNVIFLFIITNQKHIIIGIFATKIISSLLTSILGLFMLKEKYKQLKKVPLREIKTRRLNKAFIKHSLFMWLSTNIKSLTERNVMVPMLTYLIGPSSASIFKVANDGALLFYRPIIKTIGTADTSFLTYTIVEKQDNLSMNLALKKLIKKIIYVSLGVVAVLGPVVFFFTKYIREKAIVPIFILLTLTYLIEALLSPYERALEVKKQYKSLLCAYTPYILVVIAFILGYIPIKFGLLWVLTIMHMARLLSSLLMMRAAYSKLHNQNPHPQVFTKIYHQLPTQKLTDSKRGRHPSH